MSDLDVIQEIEKQINEALSLCELDAVMSGSSRASYAIDKQQQVVGLNLQNCNQSDLVFLAKLKNLTHLNLSLNQISQLIPLKSLTNLTHLNLQKNSISEIRPLKELVNLSNLNLQDNQISELKPLRNLPNLTFLNLQANQISDFRYLSEITSVLSLNLSSNQIKDLNPLKYLTQLLVLNLSSNQLISIDALQKLNNLIELDLRFNQLTKIDALKHLKKLQRLYLSTNKITEIEPLSELFSLNHLYLASNQITDINAIENLVSLLELDLRSNKITQVYAVENLQQLTGLFLENNQITAISGLAKLTELTHLNLRNNQIAHIDALKNLKKLNQLYLSNNKIQSLPKWIVDFDLKIKWNSGGDGISVIANPLKYPPPEIIRQGNFAIKAYFEDLEQQQQRSINEVKICLVGDSQVGKTSLARLLSGENLTQPLQPTQGITITNWFEEKMKVHCWDFSGDETIQATHNLFFASHCLYILVLDNRAERREEYWLKKIEYLAGNVPILIVLNKCEEAISYDVNRRKLVKSYNGLQSNSFFSVSCAQGLGLEEFKQGLMSTIKQIPLLKKLWSENWIQVKKILEQQLIQHHYLPAENYIKICVEQGIKDPEHQQNLLQSLHDLGTIVYFKQRNLIENAILESQWLMKSLYKLISFTELSQSHGLFFLKDLAVIFKKNNENEYDYSVDNYRFLINLLRSLELCFLSDKSCLLLPQLLPIDEPAYEFDSETALRFKIHYEYLDEAIISRFIVLLQEDIMDKTYWRTGVLLKNKLLNACALVKANYLENLIIIQITGEDSRHYFSVIRSALSDIEATL